MLAAGLVAQVPFLNAPGVIHATTALEKASGRVDSVSSQNEGKGDGQVVTTKIVRPGLAGEFFIESIDMHQPIEYLTSFGDWRQTPIVAGHREVRITLVSSGPVTISGGWAIHGDPVKLYLPSGGR